MSHYPLKFQRFVAKMKFGFDVLGNALKKVFREEFLDFHIGRAVIIRYRCYWVGCDSSHVSREIKFLQRPSFVEAACAIHRASVLATTDGFA